jgi:hypothetical protein
MIFKAARVEGKVADKSGFEASANSFLEALIKLSRKFFAIQRQPVGRAPQSAKQPHAALASVKKKRKFGCEACVTPKFWLVFQAAQMNRLGNAKSPPAAHTHPLHPPLMAAALLPASPEEGKSDTNKINPSP